ncbi:peptidase M15 [Bacteroidia bacterium]|nr:peptidase M15 [Bacteroidia bacterium]
MGTQISKDFTLEEMIASGTALLKKIDNTPNVEVKINIKKLVNNTLQPIRDLYGRPIAVNSGYRSPELNKAVNGAANSQHLHGKAADITTGNSANNKKLFDLIQSSKIPFDQLIDEHNYKWIHVSYNEGNNRRQALHLK